VTDKIGDSLLKERDPVLDLSVDSIKWNRF